MEEELHQRRMRNQLEKAFHSFATKVDDLVKGREGLF